MSGDDELDLAEGFEPANYGAWREMVEKSLKGADFDRALGSETYDGIRLKPLYMPADAPDRPLRPTSGRGARSGRWDIRQAVTGPSAEAVADQVAEELAEGASSVRLRFDKAMRDGAGPAEAPEAIGIDGAALHTEAALSAALANLDFSTTPIAFDAGAGGLAVATAIDVSKLAAGSSVGLDPVAAIAAGASASALDDWTSAAADFSLPDGVYALTASSLPFHNAGASEAEELGCVIASAVACLRGLERAGTPPAQAATRIAFEIALSQDQFMTIAKARAARALWAAVLKGAGAPEAAAAMRIDGVTAERMFTRHDPHVNVLRATIAGFAGAVGGMDGVTVLPFDARAGGRSALGRRLARNLQIVLAEESNLGKVADPGGGSYYVERLTRQLAEAAWAEFQAIEKAGGAAKALETGMIGERIAATVEARHARTAKRREGITGVSEFANLDEAPLTAADLSRLREDVLADVKAGGALAPAATDRARLAPAPAAAPFEALRDASDAYAAAKGRRPSVFLANIGKLAEFNARAAFAANAFAAGGVASAGARDQGYGDGASAAAAFKESAAEIACICGTDAAYADLAAPIAEALKQAGAKQVWLAGRAGEAEASLRSAGVDGFIYVGADILAALEAAHRAIGV